MVIHSETGEVYAVLKKQNDQEEDIYYVEPLNVFGNPDENSKGPRYSLLKECISPVSLRFESHDGIDAGVYEHYKSKAYGGREYEVYGSVESEFGDFVLYRPCYGTRPMMTRPLSMFVEDVGVPDYDYKGPRFFKVRDF
jgi:hypothetical protein